MATDSKKRLALAIIDFLSTSATDGTLSADDAESIDVAKQIIADVFGVDPSDAQAKADALGTQNLLSIYGVFEKMRAAKSATPKPAAGGGVATPPTSAPTPAPPAGPTPEQLAEAESLKGQGNAAMARKDYAAAIALYTRALAISPANAIFLSNRAAAYSASQQHALAAVDAQAAVVADPGYSKAWSRLGLAKFALGDARAAMDAYQRGLDAESKGGKTPSEAMKRGFETARRRVQEEEAGHGGDDADGDDFAPASRGGAPGGGAGGAGGMPDLASLASMFGGGGRGGGGGGGPDLSSLLSNPMVAQMAQSLMSNPDMINKVMSNPRLREMMDGVGGGGAGGGSGGSGGGGGLPDISSLMSDPTIADLAKNLMGGGAGRGGGAGSGSH